MDAVRIDELQDGQRAVVAGHVEAAGDLLRSPGGVECVYWDERRGVDDRPLTRSDDAFWVSDGTGRVLVPCEATAVRARADRREQVVEMATSEIRVISEELHSLKARLRKKDDPELRRRRRHLAKVATLLCTLKAHARGHVHGQGTLESQARWIEKNRHLADDGPGSATTKLGVERWEMTLSPGDEVTLEATFRIEPAPPGVGIGGGYRDRPTCAVAREATVIGQGTASPRSEEQIAEIARAERRERAPAPDGRSYWQRRFSFEQRVLFIVCSVTFAAAVVWALAQ